jgi:hypothetical protein
MTDVYTDTEYSVTMLAVLAEHRGFVIRKMPLKFGTRGLKMWDLNNACDECWNCEWFRMNDYNDEGCCGDTEPCHEYSEMKNRRAENDEP